MKPAPVVEDGVSSPNTRFYVELANAKLTFVLRCSMWLILITALKSVIHLN